MLFHLRPHHLKIWQCQLKLLQLDGQLPINSKLLPHHLKWLLLDLFESSYPFLLDQGLFWRHQPQPKQHLYLTLSKLYLKMYLCLLLITRWWVVRSETFNSQIYLFKFEYFLLQISVLIIRFSKNQLMQINLMFYKKINWN